jgi:tetratricopeptide (TPR) repeat protein
MNKQKFNNKQMQGKIIKLVTLVIFSLLIIGCGSDKWNKPDPNMPQEIKEKAENVIYENLEILEETPDELTALLEVAVNYEKIGDYENAIKYYKKLIELSPFHYPALNNIAFIYETVGEYELASKYIKTLYEQNPSSTEVIKDTVRILIKAGQDDNAQAALENYARLCREAGISTENTPLSELYELIYDYREANKN